MSRRDGPSDAESTDSDASGFGAGSVCATRVRMHSRCPGRVRAIGQVRGRIGALHASFGDLRGRLGGRTPVPSGPFGRKPLESGLRHRGFFPLSWKKEACKAPILPLRSEVHTSRSACGAIRPYTPKREEPPSREPDRKRREPYRKSNARHRPALPLMEWTRRHDDVPWAEGQTSARTPQPRRDIKEEARPCCRSTWPTSSPCSVR
ncbi:hypothetical protein D2E24_0734 [Bifidobacterium samirii]|uniref:Uncharacterized protein n=1 Tax=Bifidobacterium samirii TaxID=2306974 RepID=A0A430FV73_9BIFI|nr:hypothetical protein D2E24_0734 [Bifidobacterium samirii]